MFLLLVEVCRMKLFYGCQLLFSRSLLSLIGHWLISALRNLKLLTECNTVNL